MKALHLNLAARPYRDYRPVYAVVVGLSLATAVLMWNNVDTWLRYTNDTQHTRAQIAQLDAETSVEERKTQDAIARTGSVNLKSLNAQARYVNAEIAERAFSWSELLDRLEAVVPLEVKITSLSPTFMKEGPVRLALSCVSKTPNGPIATINRLNRDPHFSNPFPSSIASNDTNPQETHFTISVEYHPSIPRGPQ